MTKDYPFSKNRDTILSESLTPNSNNFIKVGNKPIIRHRFKKRAKDLTICIAAMCETDTSEPKIVYASDRLATNQNGLTFELGIAKIVRLNNNYFLMSAGVSSRADLIHKITFNKMVAEHDENFNDLLGYPIAKIISDAYKEIQDETIQKIIFDKKGIKREEFYGNMRNFPEWFQIVTNAEVDSFDFGVNILLLGFDILQEKNIIIPRIYTISDNGEIIPCSSGFSMIGIGYSQSISEITKEPYDPTISRPEAILKAYISKKSAQRMIGVGEKTDLGFLRVVLNEDKKLFTQIFVAADTLKEKIDNKISEQKEKLKDFENELKNIEKEFTQTIEPTKANGNSRTI